MLHLFKQERLGKKEKLARIEEAILNSMTRTNPHTLQMQISRMFDQGQSFLCYKSPRLAKEQNEDPKPMKYCFILNPLPKC